MRGQFRGYRKEPGVAPDSRRETFAALQLEIDSWRWQGVPFYIRAGKSSAGDVHRGRRASAPRAEDLRRPVPACRTHVRFRISPDMTARASA